jgi:energy-coupling factor transporter transmembrane protein EcfT
MYIANNNCHEIEPVMGKLQHNARGGWMPHPAVQILLWLCLALLAQNLHGAALLLLGGGMVALALALDATRLFTLLRRSRWIFLSLLLIYAYAMPDDPWFAQLGAFSPGRAGVLDGLVQMGRLIIMLSGLSVVLTLLTTAQLIAGLYSLLYPLRYLGVSRERIAVRLALTLRYAESAMLDSASDGLRSLAQLNLPVQAMPDNVELHLAPLAVRDWLLLLATALLMAGVLR